MTLFSRIRGILLVAIILLGLLCFWGCGSSATQEKVLFDFEDDSELDRLSWKCRTLFFISDQYATHGKSSLLMELYPSPYPGFSPRLGVMDWRGFAVLSLDIYNPGEEDLSVTLRIDDRADALEYADRVNRRIILSPKNNPVRIRLSEMRTSGSKSPLDLSHIHRISLFMASPAGKKRLYLDYIRLSPGD